jgi:hypothetical protein
MTSRLRIIAVVSVILAGLTVPAAAAPQAPAPTLEGLVAQAVLELQPFAATRHVRLDVAIRGEHPIGSQDAAREQVVNLIANGLALSPVDGTVHIVVGGDRLAVTVENPQTAYSVARDVCDPHGYSFHLESTAGRGTILSIEGLGSESRIGERGTAPGQ